MPLNTKKILLVLGDATKTLMQTGGPISISLLERKYILENIKNHSNRKEIEYGTALCTSIFNTVIALGMLYSFIILFLEKLIEKSLNRRELIFLSAMLVFGLGGVIYALSQFNKIDGIEYTGASATIGIACLGIAENYLQHRKDFIARDYAEISSIQEEDTASEDLANTSTDEEPEDKPHCVIS